MLRLFVGSSNVITVTVLMSEQQTNYQLFKKNGLGREIKKRSLGGGHDYYGKWTVVRKILSGTVLVLCVW